MSEEKSCPLCGAKNIAEAQKCKLCSEPFDTSTNARRSSPPPVSSKPKRPPANIPAEGRAENGNAKTPVGKILLYIVSGGCLMLLMMVGGCFLMFGQAVRNAGQEQQTTSIPETPPQSRPKATVPPKPAVVTPKKEIPLSAITWREVDSIYSMKSKASDLQKKEKWKQFKGKKVKWTGVVSSVSDSWGGLKVQVKMNRSTFVADLLLRLKKSERSKALKLNEGDPITFIGILDDWGTLMPTTLEEVEIVTPTSSESNKHRAYRDGGSAHAAVEKKQADDFRDGQNDPIMQEIIANISRLYPAARVKIFRDKGIGGHKYWAVELFIDSLRNDGFLVRIIPHQRDVIIMNAYDERNRVFVELQTSYFTENENTTSDILLSGGAAAFRWKKERQPKGGTSASSSSPKKPLTTPAGEASTVVKAFKRSNPNATIRVFKDKVDGVAKKVLVVEAYVKQAGKGDRYALRMVLAGTTPSILYVDVVGKNAAPQGPLVTELKDVFRKDPSFFMRDERPHAWWSSISRHAPVDSAFEKKMKIDCYKIGHREGRMLRGSGWTDYRARRYAKLKRPLGKSGQRFRSSYLAGFQAGFSGWPSRYQ